MKITLENAVSFLHEHNDFLILTHKNPDGDALGSAIALCHALRACNKVAYVLQNEGATPRFKPWLSPMLAPENYVPKCILSVDTATVDMLSATCSAYADQISLAVDHHISHVEYAEYTLVSPQAAACGEIIWEIIKHLDICISGEIAEAIYIAIATDTTCFLNSNTTAETHRITAELYNYPVNFDNINRIFFVIKTRARLAIEAALIQNMHFYRNGEIAIAQLTNDLIAKTGAVEDDLDNISSLTRSIEGVEIGIIVREREPGISKISMRSSERANVSKICNHFGGGGHVRAAGCTIPFAPAEAEKKLMNAINAYQLY